MPGEADGISFTGIDVTIIHLNCNTFQLVFQIVAESLVTYQIDQHFSKEFLLMHMSSAPELGLKK